MSSDVTSVRTLSPLNTVNFVTHIYVKPVWINISLINPKITTYYHLNSGDLFLRVNTIPPNFECYSVKTATFPYVKYAVPGVNMYSTKQKTFWK